jgi:hypothetical protein
MRCKERWRSSPKQGVLHVILCLEIEHLGLDHALEWINAVLNLAIIAFGVGLVIFLFPANTIFSWPFLRSITTVGIICIIFSILSAFVFDYLDPYHTPLTPVSSIARRTARRVFRGILDACLAISSHFAFPCPLILFLRVSARRNFQTSVRRARDTIEHSFICAIGLIGPRLSPDANFGPYPDPSLIKFAVERILQHTEGLEDFEDFIDSFIPILDQFFYFSRPLDPEVFQTSMHFVQNLRILDRLDRLLSETLLSSDSNIFLHRSVAALRVTNRLLQVIARTAHRQELSSLREIIWPLCSRWMRLCTGHINSDPAIMLVARAHLAALCSSLYRLQTDGRVPWPANWFMTQRILPVHRLDVCSSCDSIFRHIRPSSAAPDSFPLHFDLCNLLTLLNDILSTSPPTAHAHSAVWLPLLNDMLSDISAASCLGRQNDSALLNHARHSYPDFLRVLAGAGLAAWLAHDSDFRSSPGSYAEMLRRYPVLLEALRKLAAGILQPRPTHSLVVRI